MMNSVIEVPKSAVKLSRGFALDFDEFSVRLVYRDKTDLNHNEHPKNVRGLLRTVKFGADELDILGKFIRKNCEVDFNHKIVYVTGSMCPILKEIEPDVDFRFKVLPTADCFVAALKYLYHRGPENFFYTISEQTLQVVKNKSAKFEAAMDALKKHSKVDFSTDNDDKQTDAVLAQERSGRSSSSSDFPEYSPIFPCILCVFDDVITFHYVDYKGQAILLESLDGLAVMRGLASLINGASIKDSVTLMKLICQGNSSCVDSRTGDLIKKSEEEDMYNAVDLDDEPAYVLGKLTASVDNVQTADVLRSLFRATCINVTQVAYVLLHLYNCSAVYVTGNLVDYEISRDIIYMDHCQRQTFAEWMHYKTGIDFKFCRHGDYLAALGAYIYSALR